MKFVRCVLPVALICLLVTRTAAQPLVLPQGGKDTAKKKITPENVGKISFGGVAGPVTWLDDEHYLHTKNGQRLKVEALSGKSVPYQPAATKPAPGLAGADLATNSPDNKLIAFVRGGNLFVYDVATKAERQLTQDGSATISNGRADWVYFEELFNRSHKALWWSPASTHVAFLHFDDSKVTKYTLINPTERAQAPEVTLYPKTGGANPTVKLGIAAVATGTVAWLDLSDYAPAEQPVLISRVGWLPDNSRVYCYVQDRAQTWLDVCTAGPEGGKPVKLLRDTTKAWIEDFGPLTFLKDGSFLLFSERTGYKHLYHYEPDGKLRGPVTQGLWEVRKLHRIDEANGWVYFSGTRDGWLGSNLYRVQLDSNRLERLTRGPGTHTISFSPGGAYFLDTSSTYATPPQIAVAKNDGSPLHVVAASAGNKLGEQYEIGPDELVQVPMADGLVLPARVILPPNLDAQKRYPVWFMTYAGPHAPTLHDSWSGGGVRDQLLATMGFIVFRFDPRSASGMGAASAWTAYRQLGVQELKDIEAAIGWLTKNHPADPKRIGMSGHSYGGYMTAYALTHSKLFAAGIAGSPVTDWHNYDSIYTERYMGLPQDNAKGYEVSSVVKAAKQLHGKLLLAHGMLDDNVHVQNTMELSDALQKADRDFEVMLYPHARHGLFGRHYQRLQLEFMKRTLRP